jgi:hypothetical protein
MALRQYPTPLVPSTTNTLIDKRYYASFEMMQEFRAEERTNHRSFFTVNTPWEEYLGHLQLKWYNEYEWLPSKEAIEDFLSLKFSFLDSNMWKQHAGKCNTDWSELEDCLYEWLLQVDKSDRISTKQAFFVLATNFWNALDCYKCLLCPIWDDEWCDDFQKRYIEILVEPDLMDTVKQQAQDCVKLRLACQERPPDVVFTLHETLYYWKALDQQGQLEGPRFTVIFICNSTGSEMFPLWFVADTRNESLEEVPNVDVNYKARLRFRFMTKILRFFDDTMRNKRTPALLLLSPLATHKQAVLWQQKHEQPQYTTIEWLPTALLPADFPNHDLALPFSSQPADLGIIQLWKLNVRRRFLDHLVRRADIRKELGPQITAKEAIDLATTAWREDIYPKTIQYAWARTEHIPIEYFNLVFCGAGRDILRASYPDDEERALYSGVRATLADLGTRGFIGDLSSLSINPRSEVVFDNSEHVFGQVVENHSS